ncbi:MAG TPA: tRNA preQ1(34) S-adenosylmethionine ribosyltransferase-isomerase QueA [Burkholderiales bacterium]|nr:tRNA preQ1(34) S-adenosylmethionine ribosyltransferase-isomerase QueA [Burkholderiales bacterium]
MHKSDFDYLLPPELIAQRPAEPRGTSRLLQLDNGALKDLHIGDLPELLRPGDLLVFNDTRVIPARLFGAKASGGRIEMLVERLLGDRRVLTQLRASKTPAPGTLLTLEQGLLAHVVGRQGEFFEVEFDGEASALDVLERIGHVPLPPYIERADTAADRERYQTVFARAPGAVAAPTAGLHFDDALLARLRADGVEFGYVTLHVGAGTFQPMRVEDVERHRLHTERFCVNADVCARIDAARREGRRIVAVGTTVVRALESAALGGELKPFEGETDIFIYPGYRFCVVNALLTNFHLPQSTLLMLVCAFGGTQRVLDAYRHAVAGGYRFFSYGDAMFVTPEA